MDGGGILTGGLSLYNTGMVIVNGGLDVSYLYDHTYEAVRNRWSCKLSQNYRWPLALTS